LRCSAYEIGVVGDRDDIEEDCHIKESDGLEGDADDEGAFPSKSINEEEGADDRGDELDDTEDCG
jgi:hypothetical protein